MDSDDVQLAELPDSLVPLAEFSHGLQNSLAQLLAHGIDAESIDIFFAEAGNGIVSVAEQLDAWTHRLSEDQTSLDAETSQIADSRARLQDDQRTCTELTETLQREQTAAKEEAAKIGESRARLDQDASHLAERESALSTAKTALDQQKADLERLRTQLDKDAEQSHLAERESALDTAKTALNQQKADLERMRSQLDKDIEQSEKDRDALKNDQAIYDERQQKLREGAQTLQNKTGNVESRELAATRREESLDRRQESLAAREQDLTTKNAETSARENTLAATSRQTLDAQISANTERRLLRAFFDLDDESDDLVEHMTELSVKANAADRAMTESANWKRQFEAEHQTAVDAAGKIVELNSLLTGLRQQVGHLQEQIQTKDALIKALGRAEMPRFPTLTTTTPPSLLYGSSDSQSSEEGSRKRQRRQSDPAADNSSPDSGLTLGPTFAIGTASGPRPLATQPTPTPVPTQRPAFMAPAIAAPSPAQPQQTLTPAATTLLPTTAPTFAPLTQTTFAPWTPATSTQLTPTTFAPWATAPPAQPQYGLATQATAAPQAAVPRAATHLGRNTLMKTPSVVERTKTVDDVLRLLVIDGQPAVNAPAALRTALEPYLVYYRLESAYKSLSGGVMNNATKCAVARYSRTPEDYHQGDCAYCRRNNYLHIAVTGTKTAGIVRTITPLPGDVHGPHDIRHYVRAG